MLEVSSFYTSVPKTTIMWGTVHEIQSETIFFVILGHFFALWPSWQHKESKFWKNEQKPLDMSSFDTSAP